MQEVRIRVAPEILSEQAQKVLNRLATIQRKFEAIEKRIDQSEGYWKGPAGEVHRNIFVEHKDDIRQAIERLKENEKQLEMIAQNYLSVEKKVENEAEGLPTEIIF